MHAVLLLSLFACGTPDAGDTGADDPRFDQANWPEFIGGDRKAQVFAPDNYDGVSELPVILMLHGYAATGLLQDLAIFQFSTRVQSENFVLIIPEGTMDSGGAQFWNASAACCNFGDSDVDDVGYLLGLLDEIEGSMPIDADRISVVGHSNGGFMTHRLACEAPERFAGAASLAGMNRSDISKCKPAVSVNFLQMHGDLDDTIPFAGDTSMPSALESVAFWADKAGCTGTEAGDRRDYVSDLDGKETATQSWTGCKDGLSAELWTLEGGGHIPFFTADYRNDLTGWLLSQRR